MKIAKNVTLRKYTVCVFQGSVCVERVRNVRAKHRATELALLLSSEPTPSILARKIDCLRDLAHLMSGASFERDLAHESDMRELMREQLADDCGDEPVSWEDDDEDFEQPAWKYLVCL